MTIDVYPAHMTGNTMQDHVKTIIGHVQNAGFKVYMRGADTTWLYYTDGVHIAYMQWDQSGFVTISTVHIPNNATGTGFCLDDIPALTLEHLQKGFHIAPAWARMSEAPRVKKFANWDAFVSSSSFNSGYELVEVLA